MERNIYELKTFFQVKKCKEIIIQEGQNDTFYGESKVVTNEISLTECRNLITAKATVDLVTKKKILKILADNFNNTKNSNENKEYSI